MVSRAIEPYQVEGYLDEDIALFYGTDADENIVKHFIFGYIRSLYDFGCISDNDYSDLLEKLLKNGEKP